MEDWGDIQIPQEWASFGGMSGTISDSSIDTPGQLHDCLPSCPERATESSKYDFIPDKAWLDAKQKIGQQSNQTLCC